MLQVTPQLDSGGTTPTKFRPVPNVRACSKSPPAKIKIKRLKSPSALGHSEQGSCGEAESGQNAADLWMRRLKGGL